ncbi:MAG: hypothetical protein GY945_02725 [Rhodobacteraceae bacterium]|nr:hypothetical protein [Paracoccaceae bacterium]
MGQQRGLFTLLAIIALVILPSALSLSYYAITKDPNMRPLGITTESLREYFGRGFGVEIVAIVHWDSIRSGQVTQGDMRRALRNAFKAKGVDVRIDFRETSGGTHITYQVGSSSIGPYPQSRAAEGINAAVAAYRMNVPYNE